MDNVSCNKIDNKINEEIKISVAIPYYNNSQFMKETLEPMLKDDRINEIVIVDDCSKDLGNLINLIKNISIDNTKIRLYKNIMNVGVYLNKLKSLSLCNNEWAILFDSDNKLDKSYIDTLYQNLPWNETYVYAPSWANTLPDYAPYLDYRKYNNNVIDARKVMELRDEIHFKCMMNTCNYFVNVEKYSECMNKYKEDYNYERISSLDSKTLFTDWICEGNSVYVVKDLTYRHRVHPNSNYNLANKSYEKQVHSMLDKKITDYVNSLTS